MRNKARHLLGAFKSILGVSTFFLLALASTAEAFKEGDIRPGNFIGCDTIEDARAFFGNVGKASEGSSTCGKIEGGISMYIKEIETLTVEGGKVTLHEVRLLNVVGYPVQIVATFTKMEDL